MEEENEILDEFQTDEQRLQEAKDHEFAIQLSQEEMSDDKDEYASFFIKPSTAFEGVFLMSRNNARNQMLYQLKATL